MAAPSLAALVEKFNSNMASVYKKAICCPPDAALADLFSKIEPLSERMAEMAEAAFPED